VKAARGVGISAAVALIALYAERGAAFPEDAFVPGSFVTHSVMLGLSLAIVWVFFRGRFSDFGFTRGTYRFKPTILLWSLPTAVLSLPFALAPQNPEEMDVLSHRTELQIVLFVWVYASVCEEVLARGLLQTLISDGVGRHSKAARFSLPVVVSALFFGAMHLVLIDEMGPAAAAPIVLATLLGYLAARYRQATGSLIPAILVHMLFNVGGMLPGWIVRWVMG
jgi:membrane protease YdiL (CAAX protease family)